MVNNIGTLRESSRSIDKQKGVVLIVSLVFLVALTAVAAALMQNTTSDMKMAGASEEKVVATQEAISAVDEVIFRQVNAATSIFSQALVKFPSTVTETLTKTNKDSDTTANVDITNNELELELECPRSRSGNASSSGIFSCNVLRVQVLRSYGRTAGNIVEVNSGVAQQLLPK